MIPEVALEARERTPGEGRRVLLCDLHRPFGDPPADPTTALLDTLERHLRELDFRAEHARLPAAPVGDREGLFRGAMQWRLLDLVATAGATVDLLIACRPPATLARHPNKVLWLLGEDETDGNDSDPPAGRRELERRGWADARRVFVPDEVQQRRLRCWASLDTEVLAPPSLDASSAAWRPVIDTLTATL